MGVLRTFRNTPVKHLSLSAVVIKAMKKLQFKKIFSYYFSGEEDIAHETCYCQGFDFPLDSYVSLLASLSATF